MFFKNQFNRQNTNKGLPVIEIKTDRNPHEQQLIDSINFKSGGKQSIILDTALQLITITDTIKVNNDTLHIIGNGASIIADSSYRGPAFVINSSCRQIIFDRLTFKNFEVAIVTNSGGLVLKNVQFTNCKVPVQSNLHAKDSTIIIGSVSDSVIQKSNQK